MLENEETDYREVRDRLENLRDAPEHKEMLDLAVLVRELSARGEAERQMCREILEAIIKFSDSGKETSFLSF
jgi:hypothetical protein